MADVTRVAADARPNRRWYHERPKVCHEAIQGGQPVYVRSDGKVAKARGNAVGTATVLGLAAIGAAAGDSVTVVMRGSMTGFSGLTPGTALYLSSATAGELADAAPAGGGGNFAARVALAVTASEVEVTCPAYSTAVA